MSGGAAAELALPRGAPGAVDGDVVAGAEGTFRRHARTFSRAALLLPREAREDAAVVYAFCRAVDDAADETADSALAARMLARLEAETLGRAPARPLVREFRARAARLGLPLESAGELIAGVRSDLGPVRIVDDAALIRYCYRVASTVGLMMCAVLRVREPAALPHAVDLGIAMQLTNVARDVADDARRDRVYLPATRLRRAGTGADALLRGTAEPAAVASVVADLLDLADRYYRSADGGMRDIPARFRPAVLVASRVYRAIGVRLRRRGCDALAGRTVVPRGEKAARAALALAAGLRPSVAGIGRRRPHDPTLHRALHGLPGAHA